MTVSLWSTLPSADDMRSVLLQNFLINLMS